jgi:cytoskeletal protein CcmA (bactofilin family)
VLVVCIKGEKELIVMSRNYRGLFSLLASLFLIFLLAFPALAFETRSGDTVFVQEGQIKGPLFVSGNMITVDADVDGDIFSAGQTIVINGKVSGDVIVAGNTIDINGSVLGDIRTAGNTISVSGPVEGSITAAGNSLTLKESASVKRDVLLTGSTVDISAPVGGEVMGSATQMRINSSVDRDVTIWDVQNLTLGPKTIINGNVTYRSANEAQIASGILTGKVQRLEPLPAPAKEAPKKGFPWWSVIWHLAAGLLLWAVVYLLTPKLLPRMEKTTLSSPWASLGWGFLALIVTPIAGLLLIITVIGIPLALILMFFYILIIAAAKIMVSSILGRLAVNIFKQEGRWPYVLAFLVAYVILILLAMIPTFGFFINLIIACLALGMSVVSFYRWRKEQPTVPKQPEAVPEAVTE